MGLKIFTSHVSHLSSAYLHDELDPQQSREFSEHLVSCGKCRTEFEAIKTGARLAAQLELSSAPDSLWPGINANIKVAAAAPRRLQFLKPLAIAAGVVALVFTAFVLFRPGRERTSNPRNDSQTVRNDAQTGWEVARLGGVPRIDSQRISDKGRLGIGQWLETDSVSRAQIEVADIGNVEIDPDTRVRILQSGAHEHRLELAQGRLSARIAAPPKLFFVNTPSGVAEDLGCAYTLEVDKSGNSHLRVTLGWVSLQLNDRTSVVPSGAACVTRPGIGPGTPYFEDASAAFRSALSEFDFPADQSSRASSLETIMSEARPTDAMSLFYLLPRVNPTERARIYDRMAVLVAPPKGVTREGMLNLNPQMMESWQEELGLTWGESLDQATNVSKSSPVTRRASRNGMQGKR
jgi:hypothetical protein